ncbi:MAG TPA: aspartyl protease family protein [Myxococcota bacterium]|nr:aspartyl protease family protein [Myxococcota bacterium]
MRRLAACAAALALFASSSRAADSVEAVIANARAALGGDSLDALEGSRAKLRFETQGLRGSGERIEDHRSGRFVERADFGVIRFAEGFDGTAPWSIEGNNPARVERGADAMAAARSDAYRRTFSHLTRRRAGVLEMSGERTEGARRFAVLRAAPERGRAFELWLDAKTWLPDRVIEQSPTDTLTTTYADWRRVGGVAFPFALRESNGDAKYDTLVTVESIALGAGPDAAAFAVPAPPPRDFGIAGGAASATVPFDLANNHIYVEVKLAGRAVTLLCDTGGLNVVTPALAKELGIAVTGQLEGRGVGEQKVDVGVAQIARVEIGDATLENQTFYVFPLDSLAQVEGRSAPGIVGYEVFRRFVTRIDYDDRKLTLHDPSRFAYQGDGVAVPIAFDDHTPRIEAELDGIRGWFDLDTGSRSSLTLAAPFVKQHGLAAKYRARFTATTGWGVGGPSRARIARAKSLRFAGLGVREPVANLSTQAAGAFAATDLAGNIGGGILKRFDLVLDYPNERIFFEPNRNFEARDVFDRSGLWLNDAGDALLVIDVTAGGPGERAGIRAGERVRSIDGARIAPGALIPLRERFVRDPPGTKLELELEGEDGARRSVTLTLADLV